tara:strand:- start:115 stop:300 length:186 start_codon:yes stop_codon:yes gene_type:complete
MSFLIIFTSCLSQQSKNFSSEEVVKCKIKVFTLYNFTLFNFSMAAKMIYFIATMLDQITAD